MLFRYIGPNPSGITNYYGQNFPYKVAVEVMDLNLIRKCMKSPLFEEVVVESFYAPTQEKPKRGRPKKVTNGD